MARRKPRSYYDVFSIAAANMAQIASLPCEYIRGDITVKVKAYWNAPSIVHWELGEIGVNGVSREWYLSPKALTRAGLNEPKEFDRIKVEGAIWEVYRDEGKSIVRDAHPDIVVLTRLVEQET